MDPVGFPGLFGNDDLASVSHLCCTKHLLSGFSENVLAAGQEDHTFHTFHIFHTWQIIPLDIRSVKGKYVKIYGI